MANYILNEVAEEDLIRIYLFGVSQFGEKQAEKYFNQFFFCFDRIADKPYLFESVDFIMPGYRRCICGSDTIYFRINNHSVEIMTIVGRQDF